MVTTARRLQTLPPYLFAAIDEAAARARARGLTLTKMGIGDPDRDPPEWVREILAAEVMRPGNHRYPDYKGHPALWDAALAYLERRFGVRGLGHEHVSSSIGTKEALANLPLALLNPGDSFIAPDPSYPVFATMARLHGAVGYDLPLTPTTRFMPHPAKHLSDEQLEGVRVIYINYPHNPTGALADRGYLKSLVALARERGIALINDAAYAEVYFDADNAPASILEIDGAIDCALEFHSFSKSFNMTGWRIGFVAGNPELIRALGQIKTNIDSGQFNAIQLAMARVLSDPRAATFLAENRAVYQRRLSLVLDGFQRLGIDCPAPGGTIFVWAHLPNGETDSFAWCARLLETTGLVVSPGRAFGVHGEGFFRASLCTPEDDIERALTLLAEFVTG